MNENYEIACNCKIKGAEKTVTALWPKEKDALRLRLTDDLSITLVVTQGWRWNKDKKKIPAPGRIAILETGQDIHNGEPSRTLDTDETTMDLDGPLSGVRARFFLRRVPAVRSVVGPKGKTCAQCRFFDAREGQRVMTTPTHRGFQGGQGYNFFDVVARALADEQRAPYLHPEDTGYCPRRREILDHRAAACGDFDPTKTGFLSRLWAKMRGN